jgi:hypothetical protein
LEDIGAMRWTHVVHRTLTGAIDNALQAPACEPYEDRIRCSLDSVGISHFGTYLRNTERYRRDLRRVEHGDELRKNPNMDFRFYATVAFVRLHLLGAGE